MNTNQSYSKIKCPNCLSEISFTVVSDIPNDEIISGDLTTRAKNILLAASIKTLKDLSKVSKEDLLWLKNAGKKTVDEIDSYFKSKTGQHLKQYSPLKGVYFEIKGCDRCQARWIANEPEPRVVIARME